ncbi:hypothetical protein D3C72_2239390 [compost metagenome]
MQMGLRFLDEDEMDRRPAFLHLHPPCMKVQQFHDHVDQVLEAKPIVSVGQRWKDAVLVGFS